jgi:hypothetical protein
MVRPVWTLLLAFTLASSGCLSSLFGREGCPAVLLGNPREGTAHLRICDYVLQLEDANDAVIVRSLGLTPDSWGPTHLTWKDLALEARNATLRVAFQARANLTTGWDVPRGIPQPLAPLKAGPLELNEFLTLCEVGGGNHEVRFRLYQVASDRWDASGGVIEIVWSQIRAC